MPPKGICGMLARSSAMDAPMRFVARRSGPNTAAHVRAAASASTFGGDIRYHNDFADPVHVRCREPSTRTEPGTHVAETRSAETEPRLPKLPGPARRRVLVELIAHGNRCVRALWSRVAALRGETST